MFWQESSLPPILHGVTRKFGYLFPSETLSQTPDLENFATAYRSSKHVIDLARQAGRSARDWAIVGQVS